MYFKMYSVSKYAVRRIYSEIHTLRNTIPVRCTVEPVKRLIHNIHLLITLQKIEKCCKIICLLQTYVYLT